MLEHLSGFLGDAGQDIKEQIKDMVEDRVKKEVKKRTRRMARKLIFAGCVVAAGCVVYLNRDKILKVVEEKKDEVLKNFKKDKDVEAEAEEVKTEETEE